MWAREVCTACSDESDRGSELHERYQLLLMKRDKMSTKQMSALGPGSDGIAFSRTGSTVSNVSLSSRTRSADIELSQGIQSPLRAQSPVRKGLPSSPSLPPSLPLLQEPLQPAEGPGSCKADEAYVVEIQTQEQQANPTPSLPLSSSEADKAFDALSLNALCASASASLRVAVSESGSQGPSTTTDGGPVAAAAVAPAHAPVVPSAKDHVPAKCEEVKAVATGSESEERAVALQQQVSLIEVPYVAETERAKVAQLSCQLVEGGGSAAKERGRTGGAGDGAVAEGVMVMEDLDACLEMLHSESAVTAGRESGAAERQEAAEQGETGADELQRSGGAHAANTIHEAHTGATGDEGDAPVEVADDGHDQPIVFVPAQRFLRPESSTQRVCRWNLGCV